MIQVVAERIVNTAVSPIIGRRGLDLSGDFVISNMHGNLFVGREGSRWGIDQYKLMDFLATKKRKIIESQVKYRDGSTSKLVKGSINKVFPFIKDPTCITNYIESSLTRKDEDDINDWYHQPVTATIQDLKESIQFRDRSPAQIRQIINIAANCYMKVIAPILLPDGNKNSFDCVYKNDNRFSSFFTVKEIDATFTFNFKTILGTLFSHNIAARGCTFMNPFKAKKMYNLSTYAQLMFRRKLLHCKNIDVLVEMDDLFRDLSLITKDKTSKLKMFSDLTQEIIDSGLVTLNIEDDDGKWVQFHTKTMNGPLVPKKKKKTVEEQLEERKVKALETIAEYYKDLLDKRKEKERLKKEEEQRIKKQEEDESLNFEGLSHSF